MLLIHLNKYHLYILLFIFCNLVNIQAEEINLEEKFKYSLSLFQRSQWELAQASFLENIKLIKEISNSEEESLTDLNKARLLNYFYLAQIAEKQMNYRMAIDYMETIIPLAQDKAYIIYYNLANLYFLEGNLFQAIETYQKSLDHKETALAYYNLGNAHLRLKQYTLSLQYYEKYLSFSNIKNKRLIQELIYQIRSDQQENSLSPDTVSPEPTSRRINEETTQSIIALLNKQIELAQNLIDPSQKDIPESSIYANLKPETPSNDTSSAHSPLQDQDNTDNPINKEPTPPTESKEPKLSKENLELRPDIMAS